MLKHEFNDLVTYADTC